MIPICSPRSAFAVKLAASHPEDTFFDLTARGDDIIKCSQSCLLDPILNCINNIIHSSINTVSKHLCNVWTFTAFSLVDWKAIISIISKFSVNWIDCYWLQQLNFCCSQRHRYLRPDQSHLLVHHFPRQNHVSCSKWITLITITNKWRKKSSRNNQAFCFYSWKNFDFDDKFEWVVCNDVPDFLRLNLGQQLVTILSDDV